MKYKIKNWFSRIIRALKWFRFIYKQTYYDDYSILLSTWSFSLDEMAEQFEKTKITVDSLEDAANMREVSQKFKVFYNEELQSDLRRYSVNAFPKPTYEDYKKAAGKERKHFDDALNIIKNEITGWWQ